MIREGINLNNGVIMPKIGYGVFRRCGVPREDLFITTKLWIPDISYEGAKRGIVPLVKSSTPQRMKENLAIFDFSLAEDEMRQIAELDTGHTCFMPRNTGASVTAFLEHAVTGSAPSGMVTDK